MPKETDKNGVRSIHRIIRSEIVQVTVFHIVVTGVTVLIGLVIARYYDLKDYGRLVYFMGLFGGMRMIAALGLTSQILIDISQNHSRNLPLEPGFYGLLSVRLATCAVFLAMMLLLSAMLNDSLIAFAALVAAIALCGDFGIAALRGAGRLRAAMAMQSLQPLLYACGALIAVLAKLPVQIVFVVLLISFVVSLLVTIWLLAQTIRWPQRGMFRLDNPRESLQSAGGMYLLGITGTVFTTCATLALGWRARFSDAALIAVPLYLVLMPSYLIGAAIPAAYFPKLVGLHTRQDKAGLARLVTGFISATAFFSLPIVFVLGAFPNTVLGLLYGPRYGAAAPLLTLAAPVALLYTLVAVATATLAATGRIRDAVRSSAVAPVIVMCVVAADLIVRVDLAWLASAYSIAALASLLWQLYLLGSPAWTAIRSTATCALVAGITIGAVRLILSDTTNSLMFIIPTLGFGMAVYVLWVWYAVVQKQNI